MTIGTPIHWTGLIDLSNISRYCADVKAGLFTKKLPNADPVKFNLLADLGKFFYYTDQPSTVGLEAELTNPVKVNNIGTKINSMNTTDLTTFFNMLKQDTNLIKDIKSNFDAYFVDPTLSSLLHRNNASLSSSITNISSTITSYTHVNISQLLNPATSINFLHDQGLLTQSNYDDMLRNLKGTQLSALISNLPALSAISYITGLDNTTITSFIDPLHVDANSCLCEVLELNSTLKTFLEQVFDVVIPNIDLTELNEINTQYQKALTGVQNKAQKALDNLDVFNSTINELDSVLEELSLPAACTEKAYQLRSILTTFSGYYKTYIVNPLLRDLELKKNIISDIINMGDALNHLADVKFDFTC